MRLANFTDLAQRCRENGYGFTEFRRQDMVAGLRWPTDVLEQWVYDHAGNISFLRDYENVDLSQVGWQVEALPIDTFMAMPTGPSDGDVIEEFAAAPDHWVAVRNQGEHLGVRLTWETHGTWKRWPIVLDRALLPPASDGLQLVEGRTRVGILRGRQRQGKLVANSHLAWVGRQRK
ncbi:hypothetical protein [Hoyosella subflava]|uniref:Uncharacterized protein n=1 Tax=Hoyosella subflava (strain DSM 45089 / JCM 17490 / NBRC 109087 / DQS3-9A1) TaxID=443218 RepID=F6EQN1_HOYSD|nr:hypothetical protein [Hoyosella subflava]AEF41908.1 hypothetical protein AS9A_3467 [Hoyosella subflava DQS3-9A1]